MFDPKKFSMPSMLSGECEQFLGNPFGFTGGSGKKNGWKILEHRSKNGVFILGNPKVKGCFSIVTLMGGLDVAYYLDQSPKEIDQAIAKRSVGDAEYIQVKMDDGWALPLIEAAEKGIVCLKEHLVEKEP